MRKVIKASKGFGLLGMGADLLERSEGARSFAKNLGILPAVVSKYYDKKSKSDVTTGEQTAKAKKGKMMKASMGSEVRTRGVGSAIRGTNFKGVF
jgi:predicted transcriptional regulator